MLQSIYSGFVTKKSLYFFDSLLLPWFFIFLLDLHQCLCIWLNNQHFQSLQIDFDGKGWLPMGVCKGNDWVGYGGHRSEGGPTSESPWSLFCWVQLWQIFQGSSMTKVTGNLPERWKWLVSSVAGLLGITLYVLLPWGMLWLRASFLASDLAYRWSYVHGSNGIWFTGILGTG